MNTMNMPGFTAEACFRGSGNHYEIQATRISGRGATVEAAFPRGRGFTTLPSCGEENCRTVVEYEQCGSAPGGGLPPMCPAGTTSQCDYVCRWQSGIKGTM